MASLIGKWLTTRGTGKTYGWSLSQCMQARIKTAPAKAAATPARRTRRLERTSQRVEGTMTSTPSQAIWREVPQIALVTTAKQSQAMAERSVDAWSARIQP